MAHPFQAHKDHIKQKSRVPHITRGYAPGGGVQHTEHGDEKADRKLFKKLMKEEDSQAVEGGSAKERMDRPGRAGKKRGGKVAKRATGGAVSRARGGRTKHKGHTTVNVITGHPPVAGMGAPPGLGAGPPMLPPHPPMAAPPAMPPGGPPMGAPGLGGPPGMPPPGLGPRRHGGRAYAKGGAVKSGAGWREGEKHWTPVQNNPSGKNDQNDVGRGKANTYRTGGAVEHQKGSLSKPNQFEHPPKSLSPKGAVEAPMGISTPHLPGGSGGAKARIAKRSMAKYGSAP
jgi:hypothetical protein